METLLGLYEYAEKEGIIVDTFTLHNKKAFAIEEGCERAVVLDKTKIENRREEKVILSEELGHLDCDALCFVHDFVNPLRAQNIRKAEFRAKAWSISKLIPFRELKAAIRRETTLYEVAEFFDVPFSFLSDAIAYYKAKGKEV